MEWRTPRVFPETAEPAASGKTPLKGRRFKEWDSPERVRWSNQLQHGEHRGQDRAGLNEQGPIHFGTGHERL